MSASQKPLRSMTGFARVRGTTPRGEFTVNMKSLNHRGLDLHLHLAAALEPCEGRLREVVKRHVARGYLQATMGFTPSCAEDLPSLNTALLESYLAAFRAAREKYQLTGEPDLNVALRIPGMFAESAGEHDGDLIAADAEAVFTKALEALNAFREREGREIAAVLVERTASLRATADELERIRAGAAAAFQARLEERLAELLQGAGLEPQRLAQEAALLADRGDIGEEVARLRFHTGQLDALLKAGGEAGKKLDFLLQEMNREANTVLSKTSGIGETGLRATEAALSAKADIEKIREQALNLE
jgi:uncharacterized protein (TIGR00255 family)